MRAVVLREFGPAGNLSYETVPDPQPADGQLRIAVKVSGVHYIETAMRAGLPIGPPLPQLPSVFGSEVAGVVDGVGAGAAESWIGRRVVTALGQPGGYVELAVADVAAVQPIPEGVEFDVAVAMVRTGATTLGLLDLADVGADDVVLVTSAAGGVGQLVVRHVLSVGATVVGAAGGPDKVAAVRGLGADVAVDYNRSDWVDTVLDALGGRRVTVVLDGVGGDKADAAFSLLADGGRFVSIGQSSREEPDLDSELQKSRGLTVVDALGHLLSHADRFAEVERRALEGAAKGELVPTIQAFPLAAAAEAHAALESRKTTGKVILRP
ncbi:zinc-binding dehydrogenase [Phytoactinopolyspora alkaliphila]|uniref:Zinc-binding dehydrogenase n=1 Tax=Phytoactinopolyspora alkaliphila TaxID=1783498 RepID=A0A6N9YP62_9ACTN|nr:zinc-binding dehydrogenase [Phytoactinopolyspora alkaliphila]NED96735.1 zinc-binding dehydrogenase [Phytoactinopolyspora alkaliphila]